MEQLQNNFTTPEQSKKLLELGVPKDSADCYYDVILDNDDHFWKYENHPTLVINDYEYDTGGDELILPCWSVGRLIEIMKVCSVPVTTWYIKSDSKEPLLEFFMDDLDSALMERDIDFSKLEE